MKNKKENEDFTSYLKDVDGTVLKSAAKFSIALEFITKRFNSAIEKKQNDKEGSTPPLIFIMELAGIQKDVECALSEFTECMYKIAEEAQTRVKETDNVKT